MVGRLPLGEHFSGMGDGVLGHVHSSKHSGHLADPSLIIQSLNFREGGIPLGKLAHEKVLMTLGCYLRQVGDTEYLAIVAQRPQQTADHFRSASSDTNIHLIKDQRGGGGGLGNHHLNGQADPGQFASGCDLGQWPGRLAGVGADQKLDIFPAMGSPGRLRYRGSGG